MGIIFNNKLMKAHYLRWDNDGRRYLIPADLTPRFDKLISDIHDSDEDSEIMDIHDTISNHYSQYIVEGALSSIKLYLE